MADPVLNFGIDDTLIAPEVPTDDIPEVPADDTMIAPEVPADNTMIAIEVPAEESSMIALEVHAEESSLEVTPLRINLNARRVPPLRINVSSLSQPQVSPLRIDRSRLQSTFQDSFVQQIVSPLRISRVHLQNTFHDSYVVLPTLVPDDNAVELGGDPDLDVSIVHGDDTVEMIPGEYFFFAIFFLSFILQGHLHQLLLGEGKGSGTILQRLEVPGKDDCTRALGQAMCQPWWRGTCLRSFPTVVLEAPGRSPYLMLSPRRIEFLMRSKL